MGMLAGQGPTEEEWAAIAALAALAADGRIGFVEWTEMTPESGTGIAQWCYLNGEVHVDMNVSGVTSIPNGGARVVANIGSVPHRPPHSGHPLTCIMTGNKPGVAYVNATGDIVVYNHTGSAVTNYHIGGAYVPAVAP